MTEYKTFDDYVKNTFNIEPRELTHISPEEQKKKTVAITVDELINIWNELTELKLKAGRPKWHKVADGDLPKNEGWVCNQDGLPCWYDWNTEQWFACGGVPIRTIAWCETPHIPTEEVEV